MLAYDERHVVRSGEIEMCIEMAVKPVERGGLFPTQPAFTGSELLQPRAGCGENEPAAGPDKQRKPV